MRALTWNIWGIPTENYPRRHAALAEALGAVEPDVAFLQEVWTRNALHKLEALEGYRALYHLSFPRRRPRGGLVTLVREARLTAEPQVRFVPYGRPLYPRRLNLAGLATWAGELGGYKGIQHVTAELDGAVSHLINTHLECPAVDVPNSRFDDVDNRGVMDQAAQLGRYVQGLKPRRLLIGGDFNLPVGTPAYNTVLERLAPAADLSADLGPVDVPGYDAQIDFLFGTLIDPVSERRYLDPGRDIPGRLSDHPGVLVEGSVA